MSGITFKDAMDTLRLKATSYANAYTAYTNCVAAGTSGCTKPVSGELNGAVIGVTNSVKTGLVSRTAYDTNKQDLYNDIETNNANRRFVQNIVQGTEYKESKREADAVVYAWILWVMVFIITAAIVFVYM